MTFPLAVFLKNFRCVNTASSRGRLRMMISTMVVGVKFDSDKIRFYALRSPPFDTTVV